MMRRVLIGLISLNRLIGLLGLVLVFVSCIRIEEYEIVRYKAPNWTSDGRIVFVEDYNFVRDKHGPWGIEGNIKGGQEILTLCEIDRDGKNLRQVVKLAESPDYAYSLGITNTSSAGEWVALAMNTLGVEHDEIFVVKRDGTGLKNLGEGSYPDLSPDAKKIVYQKQNQGIWIKNIDGSGDRQVVVDEKAHDPAWSSEGKRIAYVSSQLFVSDTMGNIQDSCGPRKYLPDWGPPDSNAIIVATRHLGVIIHLSTGEEDTTSLWSGAGFKWSPLGNLFMGHDEAGWYVSFRDGTNKWYLKP